MPEYDLLILQPNEFECLTRDLLQKRERIFIESFTPGRDNGIDLRFAWSVAHHQLPGIRHRPPRMQRRQV